MFMSTEIRLVSQTLISQAVIISFSDLVLVHMMRLHLSLAMFLRYL